MLTLLLLAGMTVGNDPHSASWGGVERISTRTERVIKVGMLEKEVETILGKPDAARFVVKGMVGWRAAVYSHHKVTVNFGLDGKVKSLFWHRVVKRP